MRRLALHAALALALVLAGCSVLGSDPVREQRAVDRLNATEERAETVESYRYRLSFTATTGDGDTRLSGSGQGAANVTSRRLVTNMTVDGRETATYVVGDTAYTECATPGAFWGKENLTTEGDWTRVSPLGRQLALLSTGDLYFNGTETVDGRETVHISGEPSKDALQEYREGASSGSLFGGPSVDRTRLHLWVDAETNRPVRSRFVVTVSGNDETATVRLTTRFGEYGAPVRVTVPEDARDSAFRGGCPG
ncbi:hypothetical protein [Haloarcula litorea]|uniref:hypothetical protein n=1 Tax=Haloarcula litorea TaxID=3032579 RepID=UPI0023E89DD8|nr:hypothetical protein [Halomicroarcula sp. GDY20]